MPARREVVIARSIVHAILSMSNDDLASGASDPEAHPPEARKRSVWRRFLAFFNLYWLNFDLVRSDLFATLRGFWAVETASYWRSFGDASSSAVASLTELQSRSQYQSRKRKDVPLVPVGDLGGYSGSTFFRTQDGAYLVKSIPRSSEHVFFKEELLVPYADYIQRLGGKESLLIRIVDFLECSETWSIGQMLGLVPSHHLVMENVLFGTETEAGADAETKTDTWDLKPMSYFYPERDIAGGQLASEATKSRLADHFDGKIYLSLDQAESFKAQLQMDTKFLADQNAVDYSLFLVRISSATSQNNGGPAPPSSEAEQTWRTGICSPTRPNETYRAAILDILFAKHTAHAQLMTGLVRSYNTIVDDTAGPMSLTTSSEEYRERFMRMCLGIVEVEGYEGWERREDGQRETV